MADAHHLPDTDRVEREASDWIARLNSDDPTADDSAGCDAWRAAHPRHSRTFDEMCATWRTFTAAGSLVRTVAFGDAMNEAAKERTPRLRRLRVLLRRIWRENG
jgi:transmembrane sensor